MEEGRIEVGDFGAGDRQPARGMANASGPEEMLHDAGEARDLARLFLEV